MRAAAFLSLLLLTGCAGAPPSGGPSADRSSTRVNTVFGGSYVLESTASSGQDRRELAVSSDTVWEALPAAYLELGLQPSFVDPQRRLVATGAFVAPTRLGGKLVRSLVECGSGSGLPLPASYAITLDVATEIAPSGSGTTARTRLLGSARPTANSGNPVQCASTGALEQMIFEEIERRVSPQ